MADAAVVGAANLDPARHGPATSSRRRKARRPRQCVQRGWWGCRRINAGDYYDAVVIFPSHDTIAAADGKPYTVPICLPCVDYYLGNGIQDVLNPEVY